MLAVELTKEQFDKMNSEIKPTIIKDKYYITHDEAANCGIDWVTKLPLIDLNGKL